MGVSTGWSRKNDALMALHTPKQRHFGETPVPAALWTQSSFFQPPEPQEQHRGNSERHPFLGRICRKFCLFASQQLQMLNSGPGCNSHKLLQRWEFALDFSLNFPTLSKLPSGRNWSLGEKNIPWTSVNTETSQGSTNRHSVLHWFFFTWDFKAMDNIWKSFISIENLKLRLQYLWITVPLKGGDVRFIDIYGDSHASLVVFTNAAMVG